MEPKKTYLDYLEQIAADDVAGLKKAEKSYGDSWKKRGGVGAFMMLARKWDRLENSLRPRDDQSARMNTLDLANALDNAIPNIPRGQIIDPPGMPKAHADLLRRLVNAPAPYDIFAAIMVDQRAEGFIDDVRDLRCYLMLIEAEARAQGYAPPQVKK